MRSLANGASSLEIVVFFNPILVSAPGCTEIPLDKILGDLSLSSITTWIPFALVNPFRIKYRPRMAKVDVVDIECLYWIQNPSKFVSNDYEIRTF